MTGDATLLGMSDALHIRLRQSWDANAGAWTRAVREGAIPSRMAGTDAAIVEAVVRGLPPGGRVLDVGCGEGWLSRALAALGASVHGVDASAALVEAAQKARGSFDVLSYEAAEADPTRLGGPFDAAVFNFALLDESAAGILRAVASRLERGGRVIVQTVHPMTVEPPYADGWRGESFAAMGDGFEPMPWFFRTLGSWVRTVGAAGLTLVEVFEPMAPEGDRPLSLLLVAEPV